MVELIKFKGISVKNIFINLMPDSINPIQFELISMNDRTIGR